MHERREEHERFIRDTIKDMGISEVVYIEENTYDGGYEVRVGSHDFFVDYETVNEEDRSYIRGRLASYDD